MYFLLDLSHYVKYYVKFWHVLRCRSPNMDMSPDPRSKFRDFIFFLILHLILGYVTKFLIEKLSTSEVISQTPHEGVENTPPPPSAFRVKTPCMYRTKYGVTYKSKSAFSDCLYFCQILENKRRH